MTFCLLAENCPSTDHQDLPVRQATCRHFLSQALLDNSQKSKKQTLVPTISNRARDHLLRMEPSPNHPVSMFPAHQSTLRDRLTGFQNLTALVHHLAMMTELIMLMAVLRQTLSSHPVAMTITPCQPESRQQTTMAAQSHRMYRDL